MPEFAVITGFLGQTKDRFHVYNEQKTLEERLIDAAAIPGYTGVEVVHPYEANDAEELKRLLTKHELRLAAINVNIKGEPDFMNGSITSPSAEIRSKAVGFIKEAKEFAVAVSAPRVTCCPLADGYEFPFQVDYHTAWRRLCDGFGEAARYVPEMPLFIEYKPKETRGQCYVNRAADTICMLRDIGEPGLGITMDYGHSLYAGENPARALSMLHDSGFAYYIHINDNDKTWDWDYFCGSYTLIEYIEFLFYLKRLGYDDFLTSDTQPTRLDQKRTFELNARITGKIWSLLDRIGVDEIARKISNPDYLDTWRFIEEDILSLK